MKDVAWCALSILRSTNRRPSQDIPIAHHTRILKDVGTQTECGGECSECGGAGRRFSVPHTIHSSLYYG